MAMQEHTTQALKDRRTSPCKHQTGRRHKHEQQTPEDQGSTPQVPEVECLISRYFQKIPDTLIEFVKIRAIAAEIK
jgi:hypothetical protein